MAIEEETAPGLPEWFVTFADMMSLLLAFFIMLVSMSSFEEPKQFQSMIAMLHEQFGHNPSRGEVEQNLVVAASADDVPDVGKLGETLPGAVITFAELATELTEDNKRALHQIVRHLGETDATIEIRGHATQVAIDPRSGIRDAWDLADRRCHSTMAFLIEQGIEPNRLRLANAGVSEPLYNGADAVRLRENSRVEIRLTRDGMEGF
ncbi:MAG: flagellar motor protein MotB [Bythopirellula sp.]|nr:flagellar motor protein MotB [Bythopirellula sp.]